ncbi:MAG: OmpA family protein [Endomicrobia bacterium]|nr:OmpA family protein [Endomicrobiia bacterium]
MRFKSLIAGIIPALLLIGTAFVPAARADVFPYYERFNRLSPDTQDTGTIDIKGEMTFDYIFHKAGDGWIVNPGLDGLNKLFNYVPSENPKNNWEDTYGQNLLLNVGIKPADWFFAQFGFLFNGNYADRYWIPVNHEHRLDYNGQFFPRMDWTNAMIGVANDLGSLTYYRNYQHNGWVNAGDMFEMFPKHDSPDNYLRYSGHYTPDYWQLKTRGFFGDLDVIYGEEVLQDYKQGIYIKYKNIFGSNVNFFYSDHIIPYGHPDERMRNFQLNTDFNVLGSNNIQLGVLYRPFRIGWDYQLVEHTSPGLGIDGTPYNIKYGVTEQIDALGGSVQFTVPKKLWMDTIKFGYEYRGLVAGNRHKANASVEKKLTNTMNAYLGYFYQKPLLEAMPLAYGVPAGNPPTNGPISVAPRDPESPFWVWWRNPVGGFDNRETSNFSFVFTYDPTPSTWFYNFEPNNPAAYNLNPEEDAPFSFAAKANLARYFGTLDRQIYWNYDGSTVWENAYVNGTVAPNRYIGSLYFLAQIIKDKVHILYDFEVGEDLATLSYAYTPDKDPSTAYLSSMIGYFKTSLTVDRKPYLFKAAYMRNYWGPEDWHKQFGETYDELYLAHISRDLGEWFNVGMEYAAGRKTDPAVLDLMADQATASNNELGTFDELRVYFKVFFDAMLNFGSKETAMPFAVEHDQVPPQIALKTRPDTIHPDKKEKATLEPWAYDPSGIDSWKIEIKNPDGDVVKTFTDKGEPPLDLVWDGTNNFGVMNPDGLYHATLEATDNYGNLAVADPKQIRILTTPVIAETKIKETERGLEISFGAKVLFDTDKYALKPGAVKTLGKVSDLLKMYPNNNILIEGHTDARGSVMHNQTLSENRAKSVKNFLVKEGVDDSRITAIGYGKLKPIATNATAAGMEQNRRVEIIILKDGDTSSTADRSSLPEGQGVNIRQEK